MLVFKKPNDGQVNLSGIDTSSIVCTFTSDAETFMVVLDDTSPTPDGWELSNLDEFFSAGGVVISPETPDQKLARLEEQNLILMDALATTFEEILALRAIVEGGSS